MELEEGLEAFQFLKSGGFQLSRGYVLEILRLRLEGAAISRINGATMGGGGSLSTEGE